MILYKSMARPISISEARAKLLELAQYLQRRPTEVVLIQHRDRPERLALTTESHIRFLKTMVRELKKNGSRPFKVAGSMTTELSDHELEAALQEDRKQRARTSESKLRKIGS